MSIKLTNRSKKYRENYKIIQEATKGQEVPLEEAVETLFKLQKPNFKDGSTVELHIKLNINPTKSDQLLRGSFTPPHNIGKTVKVAAFVLPENESKAKKAGADIAGGEELINKIKKSGSIDFNKAVAEPGIMKNLAQIARILGVAGVMPNPKNNTVSTDLESVIAEIKKGKVDLKNDKLGNLHITCGRLNKTTKKQDIFENIVAAIEAVNKYKPEGVKKKLIKNLYLCSTMSPAIPFINQY